MNRTLFLVVSLFMMSAVMLLGSAKEAGAAERTPVAIAEVEEELHLSQWKGEWYASFTVGGGRSDGGRAELFLLVVGNNAEAQISSQSLPFGNQKWLAKGTVSGNTMELKSQRGNPITLSLYREKGKLVLSGEYEVLSGEYFGETGIYTFKKQP